MLAKLALIVEIGVPTDLAARIFLAGVRSRAAATELSMLEVGFGASISQIGRNLRDPVFTNPLRPLVSAATADWLDLMVEDAAGLRRQAVPDFSAFTLKGADDVHELHARRLGNQVFLASVDGGRRIAVRPTDALPFDKVANDPRVAFLREEGVWRMVVRDPRLEGLY